MTSRKEIFVGIAVQVSDRIDNLPKLDTRLDGAFESHNV